MPYGAAGYGGRAYGDFSGVSDDDGSGLPPAVDAPATPAETVASAGGLADSLDPAHAAGRPAGPDPVSLQDGATSTYGHQRPVTSAAGLTDASRSVESSFDRTHTDGGGLSDSVRLSITQDLSEPLGLADQPRASTGEQRYEPLGLADSQTMGVGSSRTSALGSTDSRTVFLLKGAQITDGLRAEGYLAEGGVEVPPPANDDFEDRVVLSGASGSVTGSNVSATTQPPDEPWQDYAGQDEENTIWYEWTAPAAGEYVFHTVGSRNVTDTDPPSGWFEMDTLLGVYRGVGPGTTLADLELVGYDDDSGRSLSPDPSGIDNWVSAVVFEADAGETFYVAAGSYAPFYQGDVVLNWEPVAVPVNLLTPDDASLAESIGTWAKEYAVATTSYLERVELAPGEWALRVNAPVAEYSYFNAMTTRAYPVPASGEPMAYSVDVRSSGYAFISISLYYLDAAGTALSTHQSNIHIGEGDSSVYREVAYAPAPPPGAVAWKAKASAYTGAAAAYPLHVDFANFQVTEGLSAAYVDPVLKGEAVTDALGAADDVVPKSSSQTRTDAVPIGDSLVLNRDLVRAASADGGGHSFALGVPSRSAGASSFGGGVPWAGDVVASAGDPVVSSAYADGGATAFARFTVAPLAPPPELGCGDWEALILTRGGGAVVGRLPGILSAKFTRVLDDTGEAEVTVSVRSGRNAAECCDLLAVVNPWEHELQIRRQGRQVFVGPVRELDFKGGQATVSAADLTAWWDRRFLHEEHPREDEQGNVMAEIPDDEEGRYDLGVLFQEYHDDAMKPDPSPNFSVVAAGARIPDLGEREVVPESFEKAGDALRELSRTALDFTCVGRQVLLGSKEIPTPEIATLVDEHWAEEPDLRVAGDEAVNRWVVAGAGGGAAGADVYAEYPANPEEEPSNVSFALNQPSVGQFGLLEETGSEANILDEESALAAAKRRHDYTAAPPTYVTGGKLVTRAPVTQDTLVPGARVKVLLRSSCRKVAPVYRLRSVEFNLADSGESVSVELTPLGSVVDE